MELALNTIDVLAVVPPQLPDHPANVEPVAAVAASVTVEFCAKLYVHALPHEMPTGEELTMPDPVPEGVTVRLNCKAVKVAVQFKLALTTIVVLAVVPAQLPVHPLNVEPLAAVAVRVTVVFCAKL